VGEDDYWQVGPFEPVVPSYLIENESEYHGDGFHFADYVPTPISEFEYSDTSMDGCPKAVQAIDDKLVLDQRAPNCIWSTWSCAMSGLVFINILEYCSYKHAYLQYLV